VLCAVQRAHTTSRHKRVFFGRFLMFAYAAEGAQAKIFRD
jgi:hypothetical protein